MKKQVSTLSLIALAAFSIWQYFTELKKDTKPAPTPPQQQTQSAGKTKMPLLIIICWPYLGRRHSVKNNVLNMAIIYPIQRNINVVQKINLAG